MNVNTIKRIKFILRAALAFVFSYAAISALAVPDAWIGYLPHFLGSFVHLDKLLTVFGVGELVLALWLLSGKWSKWAALFAFFALAGIVLANLAAMFVTFRDIGLAVAALALFEAERYS
jgi:hypothetical protein